MKQTKIDWCDATINPVIGCKHNCEYCYARKINARFGLVKNFSEPEFFPDRLKQFFSKKPKTVFINSMSDIAFWETDWIKEVLLTIIANPQHRYIALTKNLSRWVHLLDCVIKSDQAKWLPVIKQTRGLLFVGETITTQYQAECQPVFKGIQVSTDFINIEPILEPIKIAERLHSAVEQIIIGAETGNRKGKVIPQAQWVLDIVEQCDKCGIAVFMKESLRKLMGADFRQDPLIWAIKKSSTAAGPALQKPKHLFYKGIIFDDWEEQTDENGTPTFWANICPAHAAEYQHLIKNETDYGSGVGAYCSVLGCDFCGDDHDSGTHYIDLDPLLVEVKEVDA